MFFSLAAGQQRKYCGFYNSIFIVSLALTFVNPYGWKLWYGIFRAFFNPLTREYIVNWQPLRFFNVDFAGYWGLLLIFVYFIGRNIKKIRSTEIILPILFLALSFTSVRHIPIFAIVSALTIGKFFENVPERIYSKAVLVIAAVLTVVALSSGPKIKITIDKEAYPVAAVEYLESFGFKGNIFCEFD